MAELITFVLSLFTALLVLVRPRVALISTIAFLYLSVFPLFEIGPIEFSITTLPILTLFLRALWQQSRSERPVKILGWQWVILVGMTATAVLTVLSSEYFSSAVISLFNFVLYALIIFSVLVLVRAKDDFISISKSILVCAFLLIVYQYIQSTFSVWALPGLGGVNGVSLKFYTAFSLCLLILVRPLEDFSKRWRLFVFILINLIVIEVISFQTRSAWLAMITISLLAILRLPDKMGAWLGLAMITITVGLLSRQIIGTNWQQFEQTISAWRANDQTLLYSDDRIRYVAMSTGWQMFLRRPILGWGINSFSNLIFQFASGPAKYITGGAFNSWLMLIVEQGILGLLPVLAAFAFPLGIVWTRFRHWQGEEKYLIFPLILGMAGLGIHLFFIDLMYSSFVWLHVGIAMASVSLGRKALN